MSVPVHKTHWSFPFLEALWFHANPIAFKMLMFKSYFHPLRAIFWSCFFTSWNFIFLESKMRIIIVSLDFLHFLHFLLFFFQRIKPEQFGQTLGCSCEKSKLWLCVYTGAATGKEKESQIKSCASRITDFLKSTLLISRAMCFLFLCSLQGRNYALVFLF
jgi:hypothetical protein